MRKILYEQFCHGFKHADAILTLVKFFSNARFGGGNYPDFIGAKPSHIYGIAATEKQINLFHKHVERAQVQQAQGILLYLTDPLGRYRITPCFS